MPGRPEESPAVVSMGAGPNQLPLITRAREMGFSVIAVDRDKSAPGFAFSDVGLALSTHDPDAVIPALEKLSVDYRVLGVLARTTGEALYTAAAVAERFGVAGIDQRVAKISTEKSAFREFCRENRISVPSGKRMFSDECSPADVTFPAIVKPDFTMVGKKDIYLVPDERALAFCVRRAAGSSRNGMVEIEEYIDGIDVSCMFVARGGTAQVIAFWDELVGIDAAGRITAIGISIPSVIMGTDACVALTGIAEKFASLFPAVSAILVLSARVDFNNRPYITDLHADLTGDLLGEILLPKANPDFDFFELAIKVATGKGRDGSAPVFSRTAQYYGVRKTGASSPSFERFPGYQVLRGKTAGENLGVIPSVISAGKPDLSILPRHLEWMGTRPTLRESADGK